MLDRTLGSFFVVRRRASRIISILTGVFQMFLRGLRGGWASVLLDLAHGFSGPKFTVALCFRRAGGPFSAVGGKLARWSTVDWSARKVGWMAWLRVYLCGSIIGLAAVALGAAGQSAADCTCVSTDW